MTVLADLHTHSTASDGQYTPTELVHLAKDQGLEVLAITDHDTVDGLDEAVLAGERLKLRVIRGIEFAAKEYHTFHILGYGFDPNDYTLAVLCGDLKAGRDQRAPRIISYLKEQGVEVSLAEVEELAGGNIVGRPHFAQALIRRGYVSDSREAFGRYLDTEEFHQQVERPKPAARVCVETIKKAGGWVSLAHPNQIRVDNETLESIIQELASYGLDAIECFYPQYTPEQQAFYFHLAEKYGLHLTGGSDFHGELIKPNICMSTLALNLDWLTEN